MTWNTELLIKRGLLYVKQPFCRSESSYFISKYSIPRTISDTKDMEGQCTVSQDVLNPHHSIDEYLTHQEYPSLYLQEKQLVAAHNNKLKRLSRKTKSKIFFKITIQIEIIPQSPQFLTQISNTHCSLKYILKWLSYPQEL